MLTFKCAHQGTDIAFYANFSTFILLKYEGKITINQLK